MDYIPMTAVNCIHMDTGQAYTYGYTAPSMVHQWIPVDTVRTHNSHNGVAFCKFCLQRFLSSGTQSGDRPHNSTHFYLFGTHFFSRINLVYGGKIKRVPVLYMGLLIFKVEFCKSVGRMTIYIYVYICIYICLYVIENIY